MSMISAYSSSFLIFLLYLCIHACCARNVPNGDISNKDGQKLKLGDVSIHHQAISRKEAAGNTTTSRLPLDHEISSKPGDEMKRKQQLSGESNNNAGNETVKSSRADLLKARKLEGSKWTTLSKEQKQKANTHSTNRPSGHHDDDTILEADYDPPQRSSPIHHH